MLAQLLGCFEDTELPSRAFVDGGGKTLGSNLGVERAGSLAALDRISLSGWHQGESDNCS